MRARGSVSVFIIVSFFAFRTCHPAGDFSAPSVPRYSHRIYTNVSASAYVYAKAEETAKESRSEADNGARSCALATHLSSAHDRKTHRLKRT